MSDSLFSSARRNNFDFLRLYLAAGIFLNHYCWIFPDGPISPWIGASLVGANGVSGVQAFFVISGFFMFGSYRSSSDFWAYLGKRARRIVPVYMSVLLLTIVLGAFLTDLSWSRYFSVDLLSYSFWNLLFLNFVHPTLPGVFGNQEIHLVNGPLWTIKIEVAFYLTVPVIVWATRWIRFPILCAGLYLLSVGYATGLEHLCHATGRAFYHVLATQLPGQLCFFLSGALIQYFLPVFRAWRVLWGIGAAAICAGSFFLPIYVLYPFAFAVLVIFAGIMAPWVGDWAKYGDYSFSLYIIHFPILQTIRATGVFAQAPVARFALVAVILAVMCAACWRWIEAPFLKPRMVSPIPATA